MSKYRVGNKVLTLKKDATVSDGMTLTKGTEIEVVMDVVYMEGAMVMPSVQKLMLDWIIENPKLFKEETKW